MMRNPPRSDRDAVWLWVVGFTCAMACAACTTRKDARPPEVVVVVTTDMAVPADIDRIYLRITSAGDASEPLEETYCLVGESAGLPTADVDVGSARDTMADAGGCAGDAGDAGMKRVHLPATVALLEAAAIHIEGRLGSNVRVTRDQQVTLPVDGGPTMLAMPLDYLCTVTASGWTTCPDPTFTCQAGDCSTFPVSIAGSDLPAYVPPAGGACFDVIPCFEPGNMTIYSPEPALNSAAQCQVSPNNMSLMTFGGPTVNVALVVNRTLVGNDYGFCATDSNWCLIPIDRATTQTSSAVLPERTWSSLANGATTDIILPDHVCADIGDGGDGKPLLGVAIVALCPSKTVSTCAE